MRCRFGFGFGRLLLGIVGMRQRRRDEQRHNRAQAQILRPTDGASSGQIHRSSFHGAIQMESAFNYWVSFTLPLTKPLSMIPTLVFLSSCPKAAKNLFMRLSDARRRFAYNASLSLFALMEIE
jgi:hypothetical protein